jgi:hypothetical protein
MAEFIVNVALTVEADDAADAGNAAWTVLNATMPYSFEFLCNPVPEDEGQLEEIRLAEAYGFTVRDRLGLTPLGKSMLDYLSHTADFHAGDLRACMEVDRGALT